MTINDFPQYIFPFYKPDSKDRPMVTGTGILLSVSNHYFVITAAHVLDEFEDTIYLPLGDLTILQRPKVITTAIPDGGTRANDKIDLATFKLSDNEAKRFAELGWQFITVGSIDPNDVNRPGKKYIFTGFPSSKNKCNFSQKTVKPFSYSAKCITKSIEEITSFGFKHPIHIVVEFDPKSMMTPDKNRITAPNPKGMSGGAIWTENTNTQSYSLVGVGIENHDDKQKKVLVGMRIGGVVKLLLENFPETTPYLQESTTVEYLLGS